MNVELKKITLLTIVLLFSSVFAQSNLPACQGAAMSGQDICFGTVNLKSGAKYVGEQKAGKANGNGETIFPDGAKFFGEYKDGLPNGQGSYTWPDGKKYVGGFKDGVYHGQGTYFGSGGAILSQGKWANGKFINENSPARQVVTTEKSAESNESKSTKYCFQTFASIKTTKVDICDAKIIRQNMPKHTGSIALGEFVEPSGYKSTMIISDNVAKGFIEESIVSFKRLGNRYEMENPKGCIYKGDFKET